MNLNQEQRTNREGMLGKDLPVAFRYFAAIVLIAPPILGAGFGAIIVTLAPPRHPLDFWPTLGIASGCFSLIGLLLGVLAWLNIRRRVTVSVSLSAIAIPVSVFGWYYLAKSGDAETAWWVGLSGVIATVYFLSASCSLIVSFEPNDLGGAES